MNSGEMLKYEITETRRKVAELLFLADEIRNKMAEKGRLSANGDFDCSEIISIYSMLVKEKKKINVDLEKIVIMEETFATMLFELGVRDEIEMKQCFFEEFIRSNIKYLDITVISREEQVLNPFTYDMKKEFFHRCLGELNAIKKEDVRSENILDYEKMIYFMSSLQLTLINLLSLKLEEEYKLRMKVVKEEFKYSPDECLYLENYMSLIKRDMGFLIINTMKQNLLILSDKIKCNKEFLSNESLNLLEKEYCILYDKIVLKIKSFEGTSFLPKCYVENLIPQLEKIGSFKLGENSSFVRVLKY